jgi:hypothetical protein
LLADCARASTTYVDGVLTLRIPYRVRWSDTEHEALGFPGPDAEIQHFEHSGQ